ESVLVSAILGEEAILDMHAHSSDEHHADDRRCRKGSNQSKREKKATADLDESRHKSMSAPGREPEDLKELSSATQAGTTEPAEQFLCSMRSQCQSCSESQKK